MGPWALPSLGSLRAAIQGRDPSVEIRVHIIWVLGEAGQVGMSAPLYILSVVLCVLRRSQLPSLCFHILFRLWHMLLVLPNHGSFTPSSHAPGLPGPTVYFIVVHTVRNILVLKIREHLDSDPKCAVY